MYKKHRELGGQKRTGNLEMEEILRNGINKQQEQAA